MGSVAEKVRIVIKNRVSLRCSLVCIPGTQVIELHLTEHLLRHVRARKLLEHVQRKYVIVEALGIGTRRITLVSTLDTGLKIAVALGKDSFQLLLTLLPVV